MRTDEIPKLATKLIVISDSSTVAAILVGHWGTMRRHVARGIIGYMRE